MSDDIIQLNEAAIKGELKNLVRNSVEETLNALLDRVEGHGRRVGALVAPDGVDTNPVSPGG